MAEIITLDDGGFNDAINLILEYLIEDLVNVAFVLESEQENPNTLFREPLTQFN